RFLRAMGLPSWASATICMAACDACRHSGEIYINPPGIAMPPSTPDMDPSASTTQAPPEVVTPPSPPAVPAPPPRQFTGHAAELATLIHHCGASEVYCRPAFASVPADPAAGPFAQCPRTSPRLPADALVVGLPSLDIGNFSAAQTTQARQTT